MIQCESDRLHFAFRPKFESFKIEIEIEFPFQVLSKNKEKCL